MEFDCPRSPPCDVIRRLLKLETGMIFFKSTAVSFLHEIHIRLHTGTQYTVRTKNTYPVPGISIQYISQGSLPTQHACAYPGIPALSA